ncbi:MAG TPA: hypothetical protein EYO82_08135, partial [Gammaproteobacteria bacterium]|nr:hypothetical protein [Gammaproteobacteria bacterium]
MEKTRELGLNADPIHGNIETGCFLARCRPGYDPIAFAIIAIIAIEAGLLTPPFGLLVYTVK